ncbi:MAG: hypothetical protein AAB467_03670 [Patescibacteria group bacterium]
MFHDLYVWLRAMYSSTPGWVVVGAFIGWVVIPLVWFGVAFLRYVIAKAVVRAVRKIAPETSLTRIIEVTGFSPQRVEDVIGDLKMEGEI